MAKRFTDTDKWQRAWFSELSSEGKLIWFFLCDNCDHAGLWNINEKLLKFHLGNDFTVDKIITLLGNKVHRVNDKLWIPSFIKFQYGKLKDGVKAHQSVARRLEECKLLDTFLTVTEQLPNSYVTVLCTVQDKDNSILSSCINTAAQSVKKVDLDEKAIYSYLPLLTREKLEKAYSAEFIEKCVTECVTFHSGNAHATRWSPMQWTKAITSWCVNADRKLKGLKNV